MKIALFSVAVILLLPQLVNAQMGGSQMFSLFCSMARQNLASGPQVNSCPVPGLLQQGNTATGQNPLTSAQQGQGQGSYTCPPNYTLVSPTECLPNSSGSTTASSPLTTSSTANTACPIGSILQNGSCVPTQTCTPSSSVTAQPIANAGIAQTAVAGGTVTLSGSGSGSVVTQNCINGVVGSQQVTGTIPDTGYQWTEISGTKVTLNPTNGNAQSVTFTAPVNSTTALQFALVIRDSNNQLSTPSNILVTIQ